MNVIRSRAPLRIEFGGGGTDIQNYFEKKTGFVINAAINKYVYVSICDSEEGIKINLENKNTVEFPNLKSIKYEEDTGLITAILKKFQIENKEIFLRNDSLPNSGLGTNASLAIAVLGSVYKLKNKDLDKYKIAEEAYEIISKELGVLGGKQNQFASAFGGINSIEFKKEGTVVKPLNISKSTLRELEKHLVLVYIGKRAVAPNELFKKWKEENLSPDKIESLDKLKNITIEMKNNLENDNLIGFAKCIEKAWLTKKSFNPSMTNTYINHLYEIAKRNGAIGGRMIGAGGGGHMLFYAEPNKEPMLVKKLQENGARIIDFGFDHDGLEVWETK